VDDLVGISLLTAASIKEEKSKYLLITSNLYKAQKLYTFLSSLLPNNKISLYVSDELIRAGTLAMSKEMSANRIYTLDNILNGKVDIVIANISAISRFLPEKSLFLDNCFSFKVGQSIDLQSLKIKLVSAGYTQVNKVDQSLQFASRGDILDIFTVNYDDPIRIELFDNEIESIRFFDLASQSSKEKVDKISLLPANDFIISKDDLKVLTNRIYEQLEKDKEVLNPTDFSNLRDLVDNDVTELLEYQYTPRAYRYYSLLDDRLKSLLDYTDDFTTVLVDETSIKASSDMLVEESISFLQELFENGKSISHLKMCYSFDELKFNRNKLIKTSILQSSDKDIVFNCKNIPFEVSKDSDVINVIHTYINQNYQINISLSSKQHLNTIIDLLDSSHIPFEMVKEYGLPSKHQIGLSISNIPCGFVLDDEKVVFLTSKELFNEKIRITRFDNRFKEATILKSYEDLTPGDYVVHEYQGIGQFLELQTLEVEGKHQDYLKLAYHGGEILYVPLSQFQLIRKYLGKEGARPRLSRLHTKDWERTKAKIKERINDLAERLFNLYVERSHIEGYAFAKDDEFQKAFEDTCEFQLTKDQIRSLEEIKSDMESTHPMDRLLCGDVGFGKTEVAFRAIFKCINSGKQAVLLCPTTLLARQHYEVALERFSKFDIKIAIFSRLVPEKKQKEYIKEIQEGKIHLIIGTHRLLSNDITYKDLGLLVVDEEQRFGVEQKERLKELKSNIDVLTLSATPIPRTLQISLLGVRSMSQITTPPGERMPIQTYVTPFNTQVIKELIQRELGRDGQVFYLHNDIETIYEIASRLKRAIPSANIAVAHGKMTRNDIEDTMIKFYSGDIQILVCTSIIENGIDVPNANMIIVDDSERYGLAQLYQIKGRVGRGNRIAYAYLMYNGNKALKEDTQKRLRALQDFTALGSGYKIAQRDLMIRGAGDILGPEQAGFIDSIGLDMYIKLLNEAVKEKMEGANHKEAQYNKTLSLAFDAYIPKEYASDSDKIELYHDILAASSIDSLNEIKAKVRDVYGRLPEEVEQLFYKRAIDLMVKQCEINDIKENKMNVELYLGDNFINIKGIGNILFEALIPYLSIIKISYLNHKFKIVMNKKGNWLIDLENILKSLVNIINTNRIIETA